MAKLPNALEQVKGDKVGQLVDPIVDEEPAIVVVDSVEELKLVVVESIEVEESVKVEDSVELRVVESVDPAVEPVQDATLTSASQTVKKIKNMY